MHILSGVASSPYPDRNHAAAGLNASAAVPSAQSIRDDLEDFRLNLASYSATFDTVVRRLDANLPPADVFAEAWTRCVQIQPLNDGGSVVAEDDSTPWMLTRIIHVD